jgi:thiol-disulfide isomerase/thioredoxin
VKKRIKNLKKTIKTELIKKKGSAIFTLSIIIGAIVPILLFIAQCIRFIKEENIEKGIPVSFYFENLSNSLIPFASFFFPILIIFSASKIAQIDHKNKGWHLMETLPTTKLSVYFSKYIIVLISIVIAIATLIVSTLFFGFLISVFFELPSDKLFTIPFFDILNIAVRLFVISLCISSFQYALSVLVSSFIWPIVFGFLAMTIPLMLKEYNIVFNWYPYQMLTLISQYPNGSDFGYWFTYSDLLSILYTILFLYIGYNWYAFKTFRSAFFLHKQGVFKLVLTVIAIGLSVYFTLTPKLQSPSNRTVITGRIQSDKIIKKVYLFDNVIGDTIAKIDIKNNQFTHVLVTAFKPESFTMQFDYYSKNKLFFGEKDSIDISYKLFGSKGEFIVKGTRIAENVKRKRARFSFSMVEYYLKNNINLDNENYFMKKISEEWKTSLVEIKSIRTVDNLIPRNDYITRQEKIISLRYLGFWNEFKKKRNTLYPDEKYVETAEIKELLRSVSFTDESMLSNGTYLNFILEELIKNDKREVSVDEKYFSVIEKMNPGIFKDRLLFRQLNKSMLETSNIKIRDSLMNTYLSSITKISYKKLLNKKFTDYNRLTKGEAAPNFIAYNSDEKRFDLNSFKGKLVLIDCWASWCGPCKKEDPYYQQKALLYKNKPIQFISMNSDQKKENWLIDIKEKGNRILHLRPENLKYFGEKYAINSIPRFILIDKEGKLINADFVRPSSKVFDELLKKHLQ